MTKESQLFGEKGEGKKRESPREGSTPIKKRARAKSINPKPSTAKPAVTKPAIPKPAIAKPAIAKSATTKPATAKPAVTKPAIAKPPIAQPPIAQPPIAKLPIAKPAIAKPVVAKAVKQKGRKKQAETWASSQAPSLVRQSVLLLATLAGIVAIAQLKPQLAVSAHEDLSTNELPSTLFELANPGHVGFHIERVTLIYPKVEFRSGPNIYNAHLRSSAWQNFDLGGGGSKTISVPAQMSPFSMGEAKNAEVVMAVDYRFLGLWRSRRLFGFKGTHVKRWYWSIEPLLNRKRIINGLVDDALRKQGNESGLGKPLEPPRNPS